MAHGEKEGKEAYCGPPYNFPVEEVVNDFNQRYLKRPLSELLLIDQSVSPLRIRFSRGITRGTKLGGKQQTCPEIAHGAYSETSMVHVQACGSFRARCGCQQSAGRCTAYRGAVTYLIFSVLMLVQASSIMLLISSLGAPHFGTIVVNRSSVVLLMSSTSRCARSVMSASVPYLPFMFESLESTKASNRLLRCLHFRTNVFETLNLISFSHLAKTSGNVGERVEGGQAQSLMYLPARYRGTAQ